MTRTIDVFVLVLIASAAVTGCGGGAMSPVSGIVTYKGKPVANASVSFSPAEKSGRAATGHTDANGKFILGTLNASDGALVGKYQVSVIARGVERPAKPGEGSGMPGETVPGDPIIPAKYFAPDTSGLTFEVKRGSNRADFELKD